MPKHLPPHDFIVCPECGHVSFEPVDIKSGWCVDCQDWTGGNLDHVPVTEREEC